MAKKELPNALRVRNAAMSAQARENEEKAWEMRKAGMSFSQIARQLKVSPSTAHGYIRRVLDRMSEHLTELAEDHIMLQIARLEEVAAMQFRIMRNAKPENQPDYTADERMQAGRDLVRTSESLRKLLGLDKPEQHEHSGGVAIGLVNLAELNGDDLMKEVDALSAGFETISGREIASMVNGNGRELPATTNGST